VRDEGEEMSHRLRCSENLVWGFLGKPSQQVIAAHAHINLDEIPANADQLNKLAAAYGAMIGASADVDPGPIFDAVALPTRSALPVPRRPSRRSPAEMAALEAHVDELLRDVDSEPPRRQRITRRRANK
jgi:hypothetical protein